MSAQITAEYIDIVDSVRLQLLECRTENEIESVFSHFNVDDFAAKTEFLQRAMQIRKIYSSSDGTVKDGKEVYNYYLNFFLQGKWKEFI